jgi:hypothetical protein
MHKARAFFLTVGLGLLAVSWYLIITKPEPPDMRLRTVVQGISMAGLCISFISILIFSNKWRKLNLIGTAIFGLIGLTMYLGDQYGGRSVGSAGWGIALILIFLVIPAALIIFSLPGLVSLFSVLEVGQGSKGGFLAGVIVLGAVVGGVSVIMLSGPDLDQLLADTQSPDNHQRILAIQQLGSIDNVQGTKALEDLLHDQDPGIRAEAAQALGGADFHFMAINPLTKALRDESPDVRESAARALMTLIGPRRHRQYSEPVDELIECLKDESPKVRAAAAETLGFIHAKAAIEPLIAALDDHAVRSQAHQALILITSQHLGDEPAEWRAWMEKK